MVQHTQLLFGSIFSFLRLISYKEKIMQTVKTFFENETHFGSGSLLLTDTILAFIGDSGQLLTEAQMYIIVELIRDYINTKEYELHNGKTVVHRSIDDRLFAMKIADTLNGLFVSSF